MDKNIYRGGAIVDPRRHVGTGIVDKTAGCKRPGGTRPSTRAIQGVLQWIDEAEAANGTWARNTLMVLSIFVVLVLLAVRMERLLQ